MGCNIQARLDGDLQSVSRESLLPDVVFNEFRASEVSKLIHAGFDKCQFLFEEVLICHAWCS